MSISAPSSPSLTATRRNFLRLGVGASVVLLLEACGPSPSSGGAVPTAGAPAPVNAAPPTSKPAAQPTSAQAAAQPTSAASKPTAAAAAQGPRGGTLRVGLDVDADTLEPRRSKVTSGFRVKELAFNGLVAINPEFAPVPDLAEKWDDADDNTRVFHLRQGVKCDFGSALAANDVKYADEAVLDQSF